ncbi:MAG: hypothetical protein MUC31_01845 [Bacteroidales bacterium]|nr:hypothetical protein [Bacteroidales bacterium]
MKTRSSYKYLMVSVCLALGLTLSGQTYENSRTLREAYRIGSNTEVQVINKYGDIHLIPWEKDSVVFEIDFSVTSNKQAKVDKIFDYVDFDFKSTAYYVIAQTIFEGQNTIWSEMADVAGTIFSSGTTTKIDYTVYFPAGNDVRIENKFGNIYTTDHKGKVDITLSNGDMKGHTFSGPARINVEFGNITIDQVSSANIVLGYAEINLDKAGEITCETRSSKMYINACDILHMNSKRDRYYIKSAGELTGEAFFSYLSLDQVTSKINLKTNYGDLKLFDVATSFLRMDLASQYTDITLYINDQHLYEFDITRDDRSQVLSSASLISKKEDPVEGLEKTFRSSVLAGKTGKPKSSFIINIKSGKIYLMGS